MGRVRYKMWFLSWAFSSASWGPNGLHLLSARMLTALQTMKGSFTPLDGEWKTVRANELQAAGYEIDWNLLMKK